MNNQTGMSFGPDLYAKPENPATSYITPLYSIVLEYEDGLLRIPHYQRPYVWHESRKQDWSLAVRNNSAIASFFMYTLGNAGVKYLADGCQRLYTTIAMLEKPEQYGFSDYEEVRYFLNSCKVPVVQMTCKSHDEGYAHFVKLNAKGTILTPAEVYKGHMVKDNPHSTPTWLYENINSLITPVISQVVNIKTKKTRNQLNFEIRSNLALFYQYASKSQQRSFWNVSTNDASKVSESVESMLYEWITSQADTDVEKTIRDFINFLGQSVQLIREAIEKKNNRRGLAISDGLCRHILHFCIYSRNTRYEARYKIRYIECLIQSSPVGNSRLSFMRDGEIVEVKSAKSDDLSVAPSVCRFFDIPWETRPKRKKGQMLLNGLDNSHEKPFSEYGDGDTFPESAARNRSRGAKPIDE